jgi:hypothetical protein
MESYRFYSRKQGFLSDEVPKYKYYTSHIIELENNVGDKLVGLSGKEIFKIYPKMKDAQTWKRWYFYPIDVNIGCGPWHYV